MAARVDLTHTDLGVQHAGSFSVRARETTPPTAST